MIWAIAMAVIIPGVIVLPISQNSKQNSQPAAAAGGVDVLPSLPCALGPGQVDTLLLSDPVHNVRFNDAGGIIRTGNKWIADLMDSLAHPGTWGGEPLRTPWLERDADPMWHAQELCLDAYLLRTERIEIALTASPGDAQLRQLGEQVAEDNRRAALRAATPAQRRRIAAFDAALAENQAASVRYCRTPSGTSRLCDDDWQAAIRRFQDEMNDAKKAFCATETDPDARRGPCR
jgi:hypothetical protein